MWGHAYPLATLAPGSVFLKFASSFSYLDHKIQPALEPLTAFLYCNDADVVSTACHTLSLILPALPAPVVLQRIVELLRWLSLPFCVFPTAVIYFVVSPSLGCFIFVGVHLAYSASYDVLRVQKAALGTVDRIAQWDPKQTKVLPIQMY